MDAKARGETLMDREEYAFQRLVRAGDEYKTGTRGRDGFQVFSPLNREQLRLLFLFFLSSSYALCVSSLGSCNVCMAVVVVFEFCAAQADARRNETWEIVFAIGCRDH